MSLSAAPTDRAPEAGSSHSVMKPAFTNQSNLALIGMILGWRNVYRMCLVLHSTSSDNDV